MYGCNTYNNQQNSKESRTLQNAAHVGQRDVTVSKYDIELLFYYKIQVESKRYPSSQ
jgi:hypothetical protein